MGRYDPNNVYFLVISLELAGFLFGEDDFMEKAEGEKLPAFLLPPFCRMDWTFIPWVRNLLPNHLRWFPCTGKAGHYPFVSSLPLPCRTIRGGVRR